LTPDIIFPNIGITLNNVPRYFIGSERAESLIYLSWFPIDIYLYAVMILLGIGAAVFIGFYYVHRCGEKLDPYIDLLTLGLLFAFIGLRLYYMLFTWDGSDGRNPLTAFIDVRSGGLAIYGGIIGATLAVVVISVKKNIPFTKIADYGAPSMLMGQVIGRWGNFFNREAFGGFSDGLLAMQIRVDQSRVITQELMDTALVSINGVDYFQVHPTFFYESFLNLLLMVALLFYREHKRFQGEIVLLYFFGYGVIRFFLESFRQDQMPFFNTGIPLNQVTSLLFAGISFGFIIRGHLAKPAKKRKR